MKTADSKLRRATVVTAVIIMPVLFAAWFILFWFPSRTGDLWAWTINSEMTPITMGSGYLGGVWFFFRVARNPAPGRVAGGLAAAAVFVTGLGVGTLIHWDKFHHGHVAFWAWTALYFFTPFFLPVLFGANFLASRREQAEHAAGAEHDDALMVPRWGMWVLVSVGATQVVAAITWFFAPELAIDNWPWPMTPLTTRTIASFVGFSGALLLWVLVDRRWAAVQYGVEALLVGLVVTGIGALTHRSDFTGSTVGIVLYAIALTYLVVTFGLLLVQTSPRPRHGTARAHLPSAWSQPARLGNSGRNPRRSSNEAAPLPHEPDPSQQS